MYNLKYSNYPYNHVIGELFLYSSLFASLIPGVGNLTFEFRLKHTHILQNIWHAVFYLKKRLNSNIRYNK